MSHLNGNECICVIDVCSIQWYCNRSHLYVYIQISLLSYQNGVKLLYAKIDKTCNVQIEKKMYIEWGLTLIIFAKVLTLDKMRPSLQWYNIAIGKYKLCTPLDIWPLSEWLLLLV